MEGKESNMDNVKRDIINTKSLLNNKYSSIYDKIYFRTNEDLEALLDVFNIEGKEVLSVIGSGDQAFHFFSRGAKSIDLFDINKLTIHYYYLRVWLIKYMNKYYPTGFVSTYIEDLLKKVKPRTKEEQESYLYWNMFIKEISKEKIIDLFCRSTLNNTKKYPGDIKELQYILEKKDCNFYNIDISEQITTIPKKYDVVYTSNIRDWIKMRNRSFKKYNENLYNLLKDDGVVLCSNVTTEGPSATERLIFDSNFKYEELPEKETISLYKFKTPGYIYIKKE